MDEYPTTQDSVPGSASSLCPPGYIERVQAELPPGYKSNVHIEPNACAQIIQLIGTSDPTAVATKIFLGMGSDVLQGANDTFEVDVNFVKRLKESSQFFSYPMGEGQSP